MSESESTWSNAGAWDEGGFDAIAGLHSAAAWCEGFRRGLAFAQAEREASWPESWRAAARIMRNPGGRLIMHEDDARDFVEAGGDPSKVRPTQLGMRGVAYAVATSTRRRGSSTRSTRRCRGVDE